MFPLHVVVTALRNIHVERPISVMRLEYALYLCDWYYTLLHRERLTNVAWQVTPISLLPKLPAHQRSALGSRCQSSIDDRAFQIIKFVWEKTQGLMMNDLLELVRGSTPLTRPTIYTELDLLNCAEQYHQEKAVQDPGQRD